MSSGIPGSRPVSIARFAAWLAALIVSAALSPADLSNESSGWMLGTSAALNSSAMAGFSSAKSIGPRLEGSWSPRPAASGIGATRYDALAIAYNPSRRNLQRRPLFISLKQLEALMDGIIYLVGLIVIVMAILSFFGLR
jgi:hypothetical protein